MNSSVQFNLDSSQFAANVFSSSTGAPVSPIRRPLRKAAPYSRLSPILNTSSNLTDYNSSSKEDTVAPFSPSLASPVARRELAPVLSAIDKQTEQSQASFSDTLSSSSVNEALVNAIARIVNGRMAIEVEIREGLVREVGRMRDAIYNSEKLAKRYIDENAQLKETLSTVQEDIKIIAESVRIARTEAAASSIATNGQSTNNAAARAVAVLASDMASFKKEIHEDIYNIKSSNSNFQRSFESKFATINTSSTPHDSGERENTEASKRAMESAIKSLSMQVKDLHVQVNTSKEELKKMSITLASEGLIVPESNQTQYLQQKQSGGKLQRGNESGLSPLSSKKHHRFSSSKQGIDVEEALGVTDTDHDPSLWSNRVITRALLETYLSGIRSSLEQEAQQRRRELSVVEADYTSKLDKLIAEVGGFRAFVRDEAKTRVDAVVEAMTSAISELSSASRTHSSNYAHLQALFQEEKSWVRENATLVRDTVTTRFAGIEQAVRVQARSRVATEQAIGDALLKGLQHEQKAREEGINSAFMKVQELTRSLDSLRDRVENVGIQEELNNLTNVVRAVEQRGIRLDEDAQQSFNVLEDRNRKFEADLQSMANAFSERVDKLDKETIATQTIAKKAEERAIAEGRIAAESRHSLELSIQLGSQASADRAEAIEKEARSVHHLVENRFSRIESLIRDAAIAQAAEASNLKAASLAMAEEEGRQRISAIKVALEEVEAHRKQGESSSKLALRQSIREIEVKLESRLAAWGDAKELDIGAWQEGLSAEVAGGILKLEGDIKRQMVQINKKITDLTSAVNATTRSSGLLIPDVLQSDKVQESVLYPSTTVTAVISSNQDTSSTIGTTTVSGNTSSETKDEDSDVNRKQVESKAATKIQAVQKGRIVRKGISINNERNEKEPSNPEENLNETITFDVEDVDAKKTIFPVVLETRSEEKEVSESENVVEKGYDEVQAKAATRIQAVQRGNLVRNEKKRNLAKGEELHDDSNVKLNQEPASESEINLNNVSESLDVIDSNSTNHVKEETELENVTISNQETAEIPNESPAVLSEEELAATKIQAVVKGRGVRKDLASQRRADEIEKLGKSTLNEKEEEDMNVEIRSNEQIETDVKFEPSSDQIETDIIEPAISDDIYHHLK